MSRSVTSLLAPCGTRGQGQEPVHRCHQSRFSPETLLVPLAPGLSHPWSSSSEGQTRGGIVRPPKPLYGDLVDVSPPPESSYYFQWTLRVKRDDGDPTRRLRYVRSFGTPVGVSVQVRDLPSPVLKDHYRPTLTSDPSLSFWYIGWVGVTRSVHTCVCVV